MFPSHDRDIPEQLKWNGKLNCVLDVGQFLWEPTLLEDQDAGTGNGNHDISMPENQLSILYAAQGVGTLIDYTNIQLYRGSMTQPIALKTQAAAGTINFFPSDGGPLLLGEGMTLRFVKVNDAGADVSDVTLLVGRLWLK